MDYCKKVLWAAASAFLIYVALHPAAPKQPVRDTGMYSEGMYSDPMAINDPNPMKSYPNRTHNGNRMAVGALQGR